MMMMTYMVHYTGFPYLAVVRSGSSETGGEERWGTRWQRKEDTVVGWDLSESRMNEG